MTVHPQAQPLSVAARPDLTEGRRVGVLLSHGFTGSPASMRPWGEALAARGFAVEVPRLPGHGTSWQEMNRTRWADWRGCLERELEGLRATCDTVVVAGLSMGGGLALSLASRHPEAVDGVLLVNPAITSTDRQLLAVPILQAVVPSVAGIGNDIKRAGVEEHGYHRTPLRALASMVRGWREVRADLHRLRAPVLLFRSETDHVVDPSSAAFLRDRVSDLEEVVLHDSYHVATLDNDAPLIFEHSARFVARAAGIAATP